MRIPATKSYLPLILVAVALTVSCRKSPTEPEKPTISPAQFGVSSNPKNGCDFAQSVVWKGLRHSPAGRAAIEFNDDPGFGSVAFMSVSGIGHSGRDGICTEYPPSADDGEQYAAGILKFDGIDGEIIDFPIELRGEWETQTRQRYSAGFSMIADKGSTALVVLAPQMNCRNAMLEFLLDDVVVGQGQVACTAQGKLKGLYVLAGSFDVVVPVTGASQHLRAGSAGHRWSIDNGGHYLVKANLPGGPSLTVDEIRFTDGSAMPARLLRSVLTGTAPKGVIGTIHLEDWSSIVGMKRPSSAWE